MTKIEFKFNDSMGDFSITPPLEICKVEKSGDFLVGGELYDIKVLGSTDASKNMIKILSEISSAGENLTEAEFISKITGIGTNQLSGSTIKELFESIQHEKEYIFKTDRPVAEIWTQLPKAIPDQHYLLEITPEMLQRLVSADLSCTRARENVLLQAKKMNEAASKVLIGPLLASVQERKLKEAQVELLKKKLESLAVFTEIYQEKGMRLKNREGMLNHMIEMAIDVRHYGYLKSFLREQSRDEPTVLKNLARAMFSDDPFSTELFLKMGADPNKPGTNSKLSVFEIACRRGSKAEQVIRVLVNQGAKLDYEGYNTPLHELFRSDVSLATATYVLDRLDSSKINLRSPESGDSLLHEAIISEACKDEDSVNSFGKIKLLLSRGININLQNSYGESALHTVVSYSDMSKNSEGVLQLILASDVVVDIRDSNSKTPLHYAASRGKGKLGIQLLNAGANPRLRDAKGRTPLHGAVAHFKGDLHFLEALFKRGADVNAADEDGNTPLHLAVASGSTAAVKWLMDHGAEPMTRNGERELPAELFALRDDAIGKEIRKILSQPPVL